jgi:hypothetical protein
LGLRFRREKVRFEIKSHKINRLKTAFLKNCDLKTRESAYSNRRQCDDFLKAQYFKRLTYDFKGQTTILPNA